MKRYDPYLDWDQEDYYAKMQEEDSGEWVRYEDVQDELRKLREYKLVSTPMTEFSPDGYRCVCGVIPEDVSIFDCMIAVKSEVLAKRKNDAEKQER